MRTASFGILLFILTLPAPHIYGNPLLGKMWDEGGRPVNPPPPPGLSSVSPLSWPSPPGSTEYSGLAMVVRFGESGEEFSFLIYPDDSPGEYWIAQLKSSGREVRTGTAAREGRPFLGAPGLVEHFVSGPGEKEWTAILSASADGVAPRKDLLRSLSKSFTTMEVKILPKANPAAPLMPSSFPARELHLLISPSGKILEGVIPNSSPRH